MFKQSVLGDEPQVPVNAPLVSPVLNSELDIAPSKVRYSSMDDVDSLRTNIFEKIKTTVASKFPIENTRYRLELHDVGYDSDKPATKEEQKRALLRQTSVSRKLRGTWKMLDKETGATVDQQPMVLAHVPYLTERGTFIKNGNEYAVASQSRLKAGAYNRRRNSGEAETHFNILEGGRGFHLVMDPATKQFTMRVGGAKLKLFPLLKDMGLTDKDIQAAWGTELYNDNIAADDSAKRALKQFGNDTDTDLLSVFSRMKLDPEVVSHTLGKPYTSVTPEVIMAATKRLINISRGTENEDDRDSIAFQKIMSPDDLFAERVALDYDKHTRNMLWKSTNKGRIAADSGHFTKQIDTIFTKSGLAQALEETNPVETLDQQYKVLRTGEAGISSDGVPMESRNVQGSHLGIIDPIRGPECYADDMEVFTSDGWVPWKTVDFSTEFACLVDGNMVFATPFNVVHERYDGPMYGVLTKYIDYLVTPNHRMWCKYVHGCNESYRFSYAETVYGGRRKFMCGGHGPYIGDSVTNEFTLPDIAAGSNSQKTFGPIPMRLWAAFMGWYLSEGSTHIDTSKSYYAVRISQLKEPQRSAIHSLLEQLPFSFSYSKSEGGFTITGKQLAVYLDQFGYAQDKYIPDYLLHADVESRRALFQALLDGDGRSAGRKQDFRVTSPLLARDFQFLAISLGYSTNVGFEKDDREPQYLGCHRVSLHRQNEREVAALSCGKRQHYKVAYSGTVHCATVPGGLLYVRRGRGIGMWSGNSGNVGLDARFSINTRRGSDGRIYTLMLGQDGNPVHVSAQKAATSTVAFPGEFDTTNRRVRVMTPGGDIRYVDRKSVDFWMRSPTHMFTVGSNLVPMISATLGPRLLMGGKFYNQALPVQDPEAPLVQALSDDGVQSFEELYGTKAGAIRSNSSGRVVKVEPGFVHIQTPKGIEKVELYNNFPFNRKTFIHNTPVVQPGDHVKAGDLLAYSNATDKKGALALGKNLNVAYMPWKGLNTDDAVVISEAAAHKMASEHMFTKKIDSENAIQRDRKGFIALYPGKYVKEQLANMGDDGVIRPGSIVQKGDPLILAVKERRVSDIHRGQKPGFSDVSEEWDHEAPGQVTDVEQTSKGVRLSIKAYQPMQIGDKLVGRFGDKGVISEIVKDGEMPTDSEGNPMDVILNPMGVVTRTNPSQLVETVLGKIAAKTGKPYKIPAFTKDSYIEYAIREAEKNGVSDTDTLSDPSSNRKFNDIMTGKRFFMKLHHMSEDKEDAHGIGGYTAEDQPVRGSGGAKQIGMLSIGAYLSHGATEVLRDSKTIRGQKNNDFWKAFQQGYAPPSPEVPLVYKKFKALLLGAGINLDKKGHQEHLMALTDKDVLSMSAGEISSPKGVNIDDMTELDGGLFDRRITGGHNGKRWAHIKLNEPVPNPVMEEPIRRLLGLTGDQFEAVLSGKQELHGRSGGAAILEGLRRVDLKAMRRSQEEIIRSGAKSKRDNAIKLLHYIDGIQKSGIEPAEMVMSTVPVLPPVFRPISSTEKFTIVSDANRLYVDLMKSNEALSEVKNALGDKHAGEERLNLYNSFKAVTGLGDPISPQLRQQNVRGLLGQIFGSGSPKFGMFQRRVLGGAVDFSGRAVISPNPALDMDTVGLPEEQAWELYRPALMRRMTIRGMPATVAAKSILDKTDVARQALVEEMRERPIIINRAPTLHRYNMMAMFPQLVKGHTLQISPIVASGFNADYDGDAMQIYVPVSKKAVEEASKKMLPSRNLFSASRFAAHYLPSQEFQHGLWIASAKQSKKDVETFATLEDAIAAYKNGDLDVTDRIRILGIPVKDRRPE